MDSYSTRSAAKKLGIHFVTLQRYISAKKIPAPKAVKVGGSTVRAWSEEDIERVRKILPTIANGRRKHSSVSNQQSAKTKKKPTKKPRTQPAG